MTIYHNRDGLKSISDLSIDCQFAQKLGTAVFSYQGDETDEYKNVCFQLSTVVQDILNETANIQNCIPVFGTSAQRENLTFQED